jgi:putative hydrolase of the HAD superfamily
MSQTSCVLICDVDGVALRRAERFSDRLIREYGSDPMSVAHFFQHDFLDCVTGKASLRDRVRPYLQKWGWGGTVDELMTFWFEGERNINESMMKELGLLRARGAKIYLATNNDQERSNYVFDTLGLRERVDGAFSSWQIGFTKDDPNFWKALDQKLHVPDPSHVLVWDDSEQNLEAARSVGYHGFHFQNTSIFKAQMDALFEAGVI